MCGKPSLLVDAITRLSNWINSLAGSFSSPKLSVFVQAAPVQECAAVIVQNSGAGASSACCCDCACGAVCDEAGCAQQAMSRNEASKVPVRMIKLRSQSVRLKNERLIAARLSSDRADMDSSRR